MLQYAFRKVEQQKERHWDYLYGRFERGALAA